MFVSPLLEKTRLINSILQSSGRYIDFYEISGAFRSDTITCVYCRSA